MRYLFVFILFVVGCGQRIDVQRTAIAGPNSSTVIKVELKRIYKTKVKGSVEIFNNSPNEIQYANSHLFLQNGNVQVRTFVDSPSSQLIDGLGIKIKGKETLKFKACWNTSFGRDQIDSVYLIFKDRE